MVHHEMVHRGASPHPARMGELQAVLDAAEQSRAAQETRAAAAATEADHSTRESARRCNAPLPRTECDYSSFRVSEKALHVVL